MKRASSRPPVTRKDKPASPAIPVAAAPLSPKRLWAYRLSALLLSPLLFFLLLEGALRLVGFGQPTDFLLPARINGQDVFVQNDHFSWRFFGPELARQPAPLVIPKTKAAGTVRIFVFGESAAFGDPQPEFGLPRVIQAVLQQRFPGTRFEVFNVAMTAINSHVILPIARACAPRAGDIWVLYMGNNEVVGPYGPGTVFSRNAPGLFWIRCALALKTTRTAQAFERVLSTFHHAPPQKQEWGGMRMFLDHQVRSDDPALAAVYSNFERNLADILKAGQSRGAKFVISTVASNLKDCAPFASLHREDLSAAEQARWDEHYRQGITEQSQGRFQQALDWYRQAGQLDDRFAELHFRSAQCALALGLHDEALREFTRARDEDALRFRCDSRLNDILARAASGRASKGIRFIDAQTVAAQADPNGVPGKECFYEHVHLTFEGNYRLGLALAREAAKLLPDEVTRASAPDLPWPSFEDCAQRLGWNPWSRYQADVQMLSRLEDPPFTTQLNWADETRAFREQLEQLRPATEPPGLRAAEERCRHALAQSPGDWQLLHLQASLQEALGETNGAADSWRKISQQLPHEPDVWEALGNALAQAGRSTDSRSAFEQALRLDPRAVSARTGLGQVYLAQADYHDAAEQFQRALNIKPYWGPAQLGLGKALDGLGRDSEAQTYFREALKNRINTPGAYKALGQFCFDKKWYSEAATNFSDALHLNPADAVTHVNLGLTFSLLGRPAEAQAHYAEAVRLDPSLAEARVRLGTALGKAGDDAAALEQFAAAVRLKPELLEARLNLGIALTREHRNQEALAQFQEVLRQHPGNPVALRYAQALSSVGANAPNPGKP